MGRRSYGGREHSLAAADGAEALKAEGHACLVEHVELTSSRFLGSTPRGCTPSVTACCVPRVQGKSPEEIRTAFSLPDDLTEEEKLEPVRNAADDTRLRLLNSLYARKRQVGALP